jgi:hypothetical protein
MFYDGLATNGAKTENGFKIQTASDETFSAKKLIFAIFHLMILEIGHLPKLLPVLYKN